LFLTSKQLTAKDAILKKCQHIASQQYMLYIFTSLHHIEKANQCAEQNSL